MVKQSTVIMAGGAAAIILLLGYAITRSGSCQSDSDCPIDEGCNIDTKKCDPYYPRSG